MEPVQEGKGKLGMCLMYIFIHMYVCMYKCTYLNIYDVRIKYACISIEYT